LMTACHPEHIVDLFNLTAQRRSGFGPWNFFKRDKLNSRL
jgi:hypothetical protein